MDSIDLTMTKSQNTIECIEDYRVINHSIVVQLAQVLDFGNSSLVELEIILLQAKHDRLHNIVNDSDDEVLVIAVQSAG